MPSYEALLTNMQPLEKSLRDSMNLATRLQKALVKNMETGNLTEAAKNLTALSDAIGQMAAQTDALNAEIGGFDVRDYFDSGEFTRQLLAACAEQGIDVLGEKGVYEMFPYKLRISGDAEHVGEVWLDRKKLPSVRPAYVAETVRQGQAKLYATPFKDTVFMNELAEAYEVSCLKTGARLGSAQLLSKIYRCLAPTARARRDYDTQAFAFDLARLYEAGPEKWVAKNGTRYDFGPSRDGKNAIRVLSRTGVESFISTLRPLNEDGVS